MESIRRYEEVLRIEFGEDMPGVNWEAVVTNAIKNKQGAHRHTLAKRKTPEGLAKVDRTKWILQECKRLDQEAL